MLVDAFQPRALVSYPLKRRAITIALVGISSLAAMFAAAYFIHRSHAAPNLRVLRMVDPDNPCGPVAVAVSVQLLGHTVGLKEIRDGIDSDPYGRTSIA